MLVMLCVCVKRWILTHVLLSIFLSSLLLILALAWQIQYCLSCCADESFWKALTVNRHISASNLWNMFDKTFSMCSPPLLKRQKLGFYMNSSCDGCTRSSVLLNVWMTSRHHWRKRGQWRTLLVSGTSSVSDSCLSVLLIPRNDVTPESSNQSRWWIYKTRPACVSNYLPSVRAVPASSSSPCPTCVFSVPLISLCTVYSLSASLSGGLSLMLKALWQRGRLMCVSLLIDSLH